jgi:hypothetical protein
MRNSAARYAQGRSVKTARPWESKVAALDRIHQYHEMITKSDRMALPFRKK